MRAKTSIKGLFSPLKMDAFSILTFSREQHHCLSSEISHLIENTMGYKFNFLKWQIYKVKQTLYVKNCSKLEKCILPEWWYFGLFSRVSSDPKVLFFTRHRSHEDTSFDIKFSLIKNSGVKLAWPTLWPTLPIDHESYPLKSYNFCQNWKSDFRFVFSARNWITHVEANG